MTVLITNARKCVRYAFCLVCTLALSYLSGTSLYPSLAGEGIAPDRTISVVVSDPETPKWKELWDKARSHARRAAYGQAAAFYGQLFQLKPNIEEAAWEYCKVLLKLENYSIMQKVLPTLLEKNPNRSEYLIAGGQLAVHEKDWPMAVRYFGRVLEKDPTGEFAVVALEGLVTSLKALGKNEAAFLMLEELIVHKPNSNDLLREGAFAAQQLGYSNRARKLFERLMARDKMDDKAILAAANVFDTPAYEHQCSLLWTEYLKNHPDYLPFRRKLADYYLKAGNYQEAIPHVTYLAEHLEDNDELLRKAGMIYLQELHRPDKALGYLERYLNKNPGDLALGKQVESIRSTLAHELFSIVENDGAELLWSDLRKVTDDRGAIYRKMADLLEEKGADKILLEVLTLLHLDSPDDEGLSWRIAGLYYREKQYRRALDFLQDIHEEEKLTKEYYTMRGTVEMHLGEEMAALDSFESALAIDPVDIGLRKTCLEISGKIGLVDRMATLFAQAPDKAGADPQRELLLTYLDQLSRNYLFKEYRQIRAKYDGLPAPASLILDRLDLMQSDNLRREGRNRSAEQLLRRMLVEKRSRVEVLFMLAENAVADRNIEAGEVWYQALVRQNGSTGQDFSHDKVGSRRLLLKVRMLKIAGKYEQARGLIEAYENGPPTGGPAGPGILIEKLDKEKCWLGYYLGEYKQTLKTVQQLSNGKDFDPELYILNRLLIRKLNLGQTVGRQLETQLVVNGRPSLSRIMDVIELELHYEQYQLIEKHIQTVLKGCPQSVRAKMSSVSFCLNKGKFDRAIELLTQLNDAFPEETYFTKKMIEVEVKRGRYDKGLVIFERWRKASDLNSLVARETNGSDIEESLTLARLLWGEKQPEKALQIYERMLSPSVLQLLQDEFGKQQINYLYLNREKSFWNSLLLMLQSEPDLIGELMEPEFLVHNLDSEAGRIVASHYELYSWQRIITSEYQARKAVFERNYSLAEQNYKRLLEEEKNPEGMIDLAAVYGRTGKYRKEAQVYEEIQNTGATSPVLVSSMERSSIQMSPQNIFDVSYWKREGREGFIDLSAFSGGTSFQFTPDLNKDLRLSYANSRYESIDGLQSVNSNLIRGWTNYEFAKDYELSIGGGTEKLGDSSEARFLYDASVKGQLDQYFNAYLTWQKSYVYDTVAAIKDDISNQGIETGLSCETPVGIAFGGDFRHLNYSGGNLQNRFHGYTSYSLYGENIHLVFRYDYQYLTNNNANPDEFTSEQLVTVEESDREELLYWSPASFAEHLLSLHYQHDFLGYQQGKKQGVSYYSIDSAMGSESDGVVSFAGKFNIFLEMNPHFLLKGNFTLAKSDDYEEKGLSLSLHYRW